MKVVDYRVEKRIDMTQLREACVRHGWYTCGDNEAYSHLLEMPYDEVGNMVDVSELIPEIACDIYAHSDIKKIARQYGCSKKDVMGNILFTLSSIAVDIPHFHLIYEQESGNQVSAEYAGDGNWKIKYFNVEDLSISEARNLMFDKYDPIYKYMTFYSEAEANEYIEQYLEDIV